MCQHTVLDIIDLAHYDNDLEGLYHRLQRCRRDRYESHEKIVLHHYELEPFYHDSITGITTHNVMTIITSLDISLSVFVIFTTYDRYRESIQPWITRSDDVPDVRVTLAHPVYVDQLPRDPSGACGARRDIKHHALCIMGRRRAHKELLLRWMISRQLLDRIQVSFNHSQGPEKETQIPVSADNIPPHLSNLGLMLTLPRRGSGSTGLVPLRYPALADLCDIAVPDQISSPMIPLPTPHDDRRHPSGYPHDFFRWFGFCIVIETDFDNSHRFPVSEKTLKALITQTPFVVLGAPGLLSRLHRHGFRTFGSWWNEGYDDIADPQLRFQAVCDVIQGLVEQPLSHIRCIYREMHTVLQHNQRLLIDYIDNEMPRQYNGYWYA